jgi:hypothetical protein
MKGYQTNKKCMFLCNNECGKGIVCNFGVMTETFRLILYNLWLVAVAALFLFTSGCDTCENCDSVNRDPRVKIKFVATGTREMTQDTLEHISKSIEEVRDLLDSETDPEKIDSLENVEAGLVEDSIYYGGWEELFRSGYTRMDLIEGVGAENSYEDTVIRDFALPINMHADSSVYYFIYHDLIDTMKLSYKRDIVQTLDGVRMKIIELEVVEDMTTFDSVKVRCGDEICSNWEMNIEAYY